MSITDLAGMALYNA